MRCRYCGMRNPEPSRLPADVAQEFVDALPRMHPDTIARIQRALAARRWRLERIEHESKDG